VNYTVEETVDTATLVVEGAVDVHTVAEFRERLCGLVDTGHHVVLDLSHVTFLDAVGLGVLVGAHRRAGRGGTPLELRDVSAPLLALLRSTRLDGVLDVQVRVG
jgi:anti-anti-sigma factor